MMEPGYYNAVYSTATHRVLRKIAHYLVAPENLQRLMLEIKFTRVEFQQPRSGEMPCKAIRYQCTKNLLVGLARIITPFVHQA